MNTLSQKIDVVIKLMDLLRADSTETQTPVNLVNEMLDKLPIKIWQDRTKTFLDPVCGRGIFGLLILKRLFDGLQSVIPDEQERLNHILGKQIFLYDISKVMCAKAETAFARAIKAARLVNPGVHIYNKDSLEHKFNMKFDVVIGNPPYQGKKIGGGNGSGNAIWYKFVERSWKLLNDDGILCLIHPTAWRFQEGKSKISKAQQIILESKMIYCNLNMQYPGAGVMVDWYITRKSIISNDSFAMIHFEDCEKAVRWPPSQMPIFHFGNSCIESIIKKVLTSNDNGLFVRKSFGGLTKFDKTAFGKFCFAHGSGYSKNPPTYKTYENPHIHQHKQKVIFCAVRQFRPHIDNGILGIGDHVHYLLEDDLDKCKFIASFANSKIAIFLQKLCTGTDWRPSPQNCPATWNNPTCIKRVQLVAAGTLTNLELYKHFGLTQEEIAYIESMVK